MKLVIIVGTRPEIIRLSSTINLARELFDTTLVHTGQNYDHNLNEVFFEDLNIVKPDYFLECVRTDLGATVGDIISKSYSLFKELDPDAVLILGDTNSCLCAYSAKRLKIPIFHVEAGNRCFDPNVPEEVNRKVIDHLADINMCYMEHARRNLLSEGLKPQYTFVIGSPLPEVFSETMLQRINESPVLETLGLIPGRYFVLSTHREENVDNIDNFKRIVESIHRICEEHPKKSVVFSVHPRTRKRIEENHITFPEAVILSEPLGLIDYCALQQNAYCCISDSGTVTEESSILRFPAILLRSSTEHPEGIEAGNITIGNLDSDSLLESVALAVRESGSHGTYNEISCYQDRNISYKICKIIKGYTGIVNQFIWMKNKK